MIYTATFGGKDKDRSDMHQFKDATKFTNPIMAAKIYKVLPHLYMDVEWSVWVDANITLRVSEEELISKAGRHNIAVFTHEDRDCIYDEGKFCAKINKDKWENISPQLEYYKKMGYPAHNGLGFCGVIVRKHTPEINRLNEMWWAHISRFSIRDQISFPYVFGDVVKYMDKVKMTSNPYFKRIKHLK